MARPCSTCIHPDRPAIDAALVAGEPNRRVATQYRLTEASVRRHAGGHLPASLVAAHDAREVACADDLLAEVQALQGRALGILNKAEKAGDLRAATSAIREARSCVELLARLLAAAIAATAEEDQRRPGRSEYAHLSDEELLLACACSLVEEGWSVSTPDGSVVEAGAYEAHLEAEALADGWTGNPAYWDAWLRGKPQASRPR